MDSIEDETLFRKLTQLTAAELELVTMIVILGFSMTEIAKKRGCSRSAISKKFTKIKNFLK
jgi:DNA-directed RNA polymerase specialized sigma24 family protein